MTETVNAAETIETAETTKVVYFYFIHAEYARKLDRPAVEYRDMPNGYVRSEREYETSSGFMSGTVTFPEGTTRFDILKAAMKLALDSMNKSRTVQGQAPLFGPEHMRVTSFGCDRNEL